MKIVKESEILKAKTKTNKTKYWKVQVVTDGNHYYTRTEYWQVGDNGESKHQFSEPYLASPKNQGRANETTSEQQAHKEFDSIIKKQKDSGYVSSSVNLDTMIVERPLPMLAQLYQDRKKVVTWPAAGQPKLDGARAVYKTELNYWTRKGISYIDKVVEHLQFDTKGYIFDGEIMIPHGDASFQSSMSAIKKYEKGISEKLRYFIYDVVIKDMPFRERHKLIKSFKFPKTVVVVETADLSSEKEFFKFHKKCVKQGYEGSILRNWDADYSINHRSANLLKNKDFIDEEFEITDVIEAGSGSFAGAGKFIVKVSDTVSCDVNPEGTMEYKREILKNKTKYIGKHLTVKFQGYTDKGSLRNPVGIIVRDYE